MDSIEGLIREFWEPPSSLRLRSRSKQQQVRQHSQEHPQRHRSHGKYVNASDSKYRRGPLTRPFVYPSVFSDDDDDDDDDDEEQSTSSFGSDFERKFNEEVQSIDERDHHQVNSILLNLESMMAKSDHDQDRDDNDEHQLCHDTGDDDDRDDASTSSASSVKTQHVRNTSLYVTEKKKQFHRFVKGTNTFKGARTIDSSGCMMPKTDPLGYHSNRGSYESSCFGSLVDTMSIDDDDHDLDHIKKTMDFYETSDPSIVRNEAHLHAEDHLVHDTDPVRELEPLSSINSTLQKISSTARNVNDLVETYTHVVVASLPHPYQKGNTVKTTQAEVSPLENDSWSGHASQPEEVDDESDNLSGCVPFYDAIEAKERKIKTLNLLTEIQSTASHNNDEDSAECHSMSSLNNCDDSGNVTPLQCIDSEPTQTTLRKVKDAFIKDSIALCQNTDDNLFGLVFERSAENMAVIDESAQQMIRSTVPEVQFIGLAILLAPFRSFNLRSKEN